eukprot:TRINITY_DN44839_c0_g1_i1.p1 TRINITY_DN44839_c0_g1~~TRINITY_DN44839_c0_g1_i1.p1  ORF type:complete len:968 (-),score=312.68 TRINITY_DN44839_c0_g1_i1:133-3036(-)
MDFGGRQHHSAADGVEELLRDTQELYGIVGSHEQRLDSLQVMVQTREDKIELLSKRVGQTDWGKLLEQINKTLEHVGGRSAATASADGGSAGASSPRLRNLESQIRKLTAQVGYLEDSGRSVLPGLTPAAQGPPRIGVGAVEQHGATRKDVVDALQPLKGDIARFKEQVERRENSLESFSHETKTELRTLSMEFQRYKANDWATVQIVQNLIRPLEKGLEQKPSKTDIVTPKDLGDFAESTVDEMMRLVELASYGKRAASDSKQALQISAELQDELRSFSDNVTEEVAELRADTSTSFEDIATLREEVLDLKEKCGGLIGKRLEAHLDAMAGSHMEAVHAVEQRLEMHTAHTQKVFDDLRKELVAELHRELGGLHKDVHDRMDEQQDEMTRLGTRIDELETMAMTVEKRAATDARGRKVQPAQAAPPAMMLAPSPEMAVAAPAVHAATEELKNAMSLIQRQQDQDGKMFVGMQEELRSFKDAFADFKIQEREQRIDADRQERDERREAVQSVRALLLEERQAAADASSGKGTQLTGAIQRLDDLVADSSKHAADIQQLRSRLDISMEQNKDDQILLASHCEDLGRRTDQLGDRIVRLEAQVEAQDDAAVQESEAVRRAQAEIVRALTRVSEKVDDEVSAAKQGKQRSVRARSALESFAVRPNQLVVAAAIFASWRRAIDDIVMQKRDKEKQKQAQASRDNVQSKVRRAMRAIGDVHGQARNMYVQEKVYQAWRSYFLLTQTAKRERRIKASLDETQALLEAERRRRGGLEAQLAQVHQREQTVRSQAAIETENQILVAQARAAAELQSSSSRQQARRDAEHLDALNSPAALAAAAAQYPPSVAITSAQAASSGLPYSPQLAQPPAYQTLSSPYSPSPLSPQSQTTYRAPQSPAYPAGRGQEAQFPDTDEDEDFQQDLQAYREQVELQDAAESIQKKARYKRAKAQAEAAVGAKQSQQQQPLDEDEEY